MRKITAISIFGLNGRVDVRLPIAGGHCVIVGPNGSGKSTALQIVSCALGREWKQLSSLRFESIAVEWDDQTATLKRTSCQSLAQGSAGPARFGGLYKHLTEIELLEAFQTADLENQSASARFSSLLGLSARDLAIAQRSLRFRHSDKDAQAEVTQFQKALSDNGVPKALYLPTSRRIEFDLQRLTEKLPQYVKAEFINALRTPSSLNFYEEILRFGMDDIETIIRDFEKKTRDYSRNRFNKMMSSYLKEMANSQAISIHDLRSFKIDQRRVDAVLSRIEEGLLSSEEKGEIGNIVMSMAKPMKGGHPPFHKRWLAHFFVRLLEVDADIADLERPIRELESDLQKYLTPKRVYYDIENYHFSISDNLENELKMSDLSSGEKQLVSLLAILKVSSQEPMNVFIDEPELSLSVPWQSDFLPDLTRSRSCNQLFAVTHSPFIFDNDLANSVVDFLECASH